MLMRSLFPVKKICLVSAILAAFYMSSTNAQCVFPDEVVRLLERGQDDVGLKKEISVAIARRNMAYCITPSSENGYLAVPLYVDQQNQLNHSENQSKKSDDEDVEDSKKINSKSMKWGYLNSKGQLAIAAKFDLALPFTKASRALVKEKNDIYWIDESGKKIKNATEQEIDQLLRGISDAPADAVSPQENIEKIQKNTTIALWNQKTQEYLPLPKGVANVMHLNGRDFFVQMKEINLDAYVPDASRHVWRRGTFVGNTFRWLDEARYFGLSSYFTPKDERLVYQMSKKYGKTVSKNFYLINQMGKLIALPQLEPQKIYRNFLISTAIDNEHKVLVHHIPSGKLVYSKVLAESQSYFPAGLRDNCFQLEQTKKCFDQQGRFVKQLNDDDSKQSILKSVYPEIYRHLPKAKNISSVDALFEAVSEPKKVLLMSNHQQSFLTGWVIKAKQKYRFLTDPSWQAVSLIKNNLDELLVVKTNQGVGLMTPEGKWRLAPRYQHIQAEFALENSRNLLAFDGKGHVVIDQDNQIYPLPQAHDIKLLSDELVALKILPTLDATWKIFNLKQQKFLDVANIESVKPLSEKAFLVKKENRWGVLNHDGQWIFKPNDLFLDDNSRNVAFLKWLIDHQLNEKILRQQGTYDILFGQGTYDIVFGVDINAVSRFSFFKKHLVIQYGDSVHQHENILTNAGKFLLSEPAKTIIDIDHDWFAVHQTNQHIYGDGKQAFVLPASWQLIASPNDQKYLLVASLYETRLLPKDNPNLETPLAVFPANTFAKEGEQWLRVQDSEKNNTTYYDLQGKEVLKVPYVAEHFVGDFARINIIKNDQILTGAINRKGQIIVEPKFKLFSSFSEGMAIFSDAQNTNTIRRKMGVLDINGKIVIPAIYDGLLPFNNGLTIAWKDNNFFYMDKLGKTVAILNVDCGVPILKNSDGKLLSDQPKGCE